MKRGTIITLVVLAAIVIVIVGLVYSAQSQPIQIETSKVKKGDVEDIVSASGRIEANRLIPVVSSRADKVIGVLVKEGDHVEKDQELVDLDTSDTIESPIAGTVVKIDAKVDQNVGPGTPVMTIADMDTVYVVSNVDETDISKIKVGQPVNISLDSYPKAKVSGEVSEIGLVATATQTGGTAFPVKIRITSAPGVTIRVGMSADTDIVLAKYSNVTVVAVQAVTVKGGKDVVFLLSGSQVKMKEVSLGLLSGDFYEIKEGLTVGDEVAITAIDKLSDSAKVRVKR